MPSALLLNNIQICFFLMLFCPQIIFGQAQTFSEENHILYGTNNAFFIEEFVYVPNFINKVKLKSAIFKTYTKTHKEAHFKDTATYWQGTSDSSSVVYQNKCIKSYSCNFDRWHNITSYNKLKRSITKTKNYLKVVDTIETRSMDENIIRRDTFSHEIIKNSDKTYTHLFKSKLSAKFSYSGDTLIEYRYGYANKLSFTNKYVMNSNKQTVHFFQIYKSKLTAENKFYYNKAGKLEKLDQYVYSKDTTHLSIVYQYNKMGFVSRIEKNTNNQSYRIKTVDYKLNEKMDWDEITITSTSNYNELPDVRIYKKAVITEK